MKKLAAGLFYQLPKSLQIRLQQRVSLLYDMAGFGDTLMVGAVAREIKKKFGNVKVTVNRTRDELLRHNPYVDYVSQRYDGIDLNYHYGKYYAGTPFTTNLIEVMCRKVGITHPSHSVDIFLTTEEKQFAQILTKGMKRPIVTIHTTSDNFDNGRKMWPLGYWRILVSLLNREKCTIIQLGGLGEKRIKGTVNCTNKYDIRRSIALIWAADLHVGIVSSLMHGAAAVKKPSVILYGGFEQSQLHDYKTVIPLESHISCAPCIKANTIIEKCQINNKCMYEILPERVFSTVKEVLS